MDWLVAGGDLVVQLIDLVVEIINVVVVDDGHDSGDGSRRSRWST